MEDNSVLNCIFCKTKDFHSPTQLKIHIKKYHPEKKNKVIIPKVKCRYCKKFFSALTQHIRRIHSLEPEDIEFRRKEKNQSLKFYYKNKSI
tara:strand:+ start:149 stop:421 length:273 start_codon:yes stop_codon:yes gene_type:complete